VIGRAYGAAGQLLAASCDMLYILAILALRAATS
jgi:hypothetical protein